MDQRQPGPRRLVEQRPQLRAVAVAQVERPVAVLAVGVVVAAASFAGAVDGVQLARQLQVIGPVFALADVPRVEPAPGELAVDPAAACPRAHQPRHQPRVAPVQPQGELDRQRSLAGRPRAGVDQLPQRQLPGRPLVRRRSPRFSLPLYRAGALARRDDRQRRDVLAVASDRTGALPLLECEARPVVDEVRGRRVERGPGHQGGQRPLLRVPLDAHHPPVAGVAAPPVERPRPHRRPDLRKVNLAQLVRVMHGGAH